MHALRGLTCGTVPGSAAPADWALSAITAMAAAIGRRTCILTGISFDSPEGRAPFRLINASSSDAFLALALLHLDAEIVDLLAQSVAVEAQDFSGPDLVAARGGKGQLDQGTLDVF